MDPCGPGAPDLDPRLQRRVRAHRALGDFTGIERLEPGLGQARVVGELLRQARQVVDFDLGATITGDGTYCFALDSTSSNGVDYASRESGANGPVVLLTLAP